MAEITSAATGDWATGATWVGGTPPGDGDTAVIAATHIIYVTTSVTIGTDGATGTKAITVQSTGSLYIGGQVNCKGDLYQQLGSAVTVSSGGHLILDAPTGSTYKWYADNTGTGNAKADVSGSSGSGAALSSGSRGGGNGYMEFDASGTVNARVRFSNATLTSIGDASTPAAKIRILDGTDTHTVEFSLLKSCGEIQVSNLHKDVTCDWDLVDVREPASTNIATFFGTSAIDFGSRLFNKVTVYSESSVHAVNFNAPDFTVTDVYSLNCKLLMSSGGLRLDISNSVMMTDQTSTNHIGLAGNSGSSVANVLSVMHCSNQQHASETSYSLTEGANTYTGVVFDGDDYFDTSAGDCILPKGPATILQCIAFNKAGSLVTATGSDCAVTLRRNTCFETYPSLIGETTGAAGQIVSAYSNLFVSQDGGLEQGSDFVAQTGFALDYNASFGMSDSTNENYPVGHSESGLNSYLGNEATEYWSPAEVFGTDNATNDVIANPTFRGSNVTSISYISAASVQALAREFVTINGRDYQGNDTTETEETSATILAFLRSGFTPTSPDLDGTGYMGEDIGAVDVDVVSPLSDDFTDTDGTALTDHNSNWAQVKSTRPIFNAEINNNLLESVTATSAFSARRIDSTSDYSEADFIGDAGIVNYDERSIAVRLASSNYGYSINFEGASGNYTTIAAYKDGTWLADIATGLSLSASTTYTVGIKVSGVAPVTIEAFVDGESQGTTVDSTDPIPVGNPGLFTSGSPSTLVDTRFDNWSNVAPVNPDIETVADLTLAPEIDGVALSGNTQSDPADLTLAPEIDAITLESDTQADPADLTLAPSIDQNIALSNSKILVTPADLTLAPSLDIPEVDPEESVEPAEPTLAPTLDSLTLESDTQISAADLTMAPSIDQNFEISTTFTISSADLTLAINLDVPEVDPEESAEPADLTLGPSIDTFDVSGDVELAMADLTLAPALDSPHVDNSINLVVPDLTVAPSLDNITLSLGYVSLDYDNDPSIRIVASSISSVSIAGIRSVAVASATPNIEVVKQRQGR